MRAQLLAAFSIPSLPCQPLLREKKALAVEGIFGAALLVSPAFYKWICGRIYWFLLTDRGAARTQYITKMWSLLTGKNRHLLYITASRKKWHFQQSKDKVCETDPLFLLQHRNPRATSAGREVGLTTPGGPTFQQSNSRNSRKNSTSTNIWRELGELRSLLRCNLTRPRWGVGKQPNNKVLKFPDDDMTDRPLT